MGREYWDMFDVACGECDLIAFLLGRFNEMDLKTKIHIDSRARFTEQFVPPPKDDLLETEPAPPPPEPAAPRPLVLSAAAPLSPQQPKPPENDGRDSFRASAPPPQGPSEDDLFEALPEEEEAPPPLQKQVDLMSLIQGFHAAAEKYKTEKLDDTQDEEE